MDANTQSSIPAHKAALETRQADLMARLAAIDTELDSHQNPDWDDLAVEREPDEVLEATGHSGQQELRQIEAALHRIATGEYGLCAKCGSEIGEDRLNVLPETPLCRDCAI